MASMRKDGLRRWFGPMICVVAGHDASQRRARNASNGAYVSVCRRCNVRLVREGVVWRVDPEVKP